MTHPLFWLALWYAGAWYVVLVIAADAAETVGPHLMAPADWVTLVVVAAVVWAASPLIVPVVAVWVVGRALWREMT